jgi:hydrogenase maturation protease
LRAVTTTEPHGGVAPVLVFACGNPSRGDDALGPAFVDRVAVLLDEAVGAGELELLTDFQLSAEHALDLAGREEVVFVDASVSCAAPFAWTQAVPAHDLTYSTHVMSPAAVLATYVAVHGSDPPPALVLAIRGEAFELGAPLSAAAAANLDAAVRAFVERFAVRAGGRADRN